MDERLRSLIREILSREKLPAIEPVLREVPFEGRLGLALSNVFQIAREARPDSGKEELREYADALANLLAERLRETGEFEKVETEKGYVNCFFRTGAFAREMVGRIVTDGVSWGRGESPGGRVMVEYSQPNTHKAFHIGHVRNVVTGAALLRCFRYAGRETVGANYYGDIGSHVFKTLWYFLKFDPDLRDAPSDPSERGKWLGSIYAVADTLLSESQELKYKVWDILKSLNQAMKEEWSDDELIRSIEIEPLLRRVALNEEDLFENRASEDVDRIIEDLYKASLKLYTEASEKGVLHDAEEVERHVGSLEEVISRPDFREVWNRSKELVDVAERWKRRDRKLVDLWEKTRQWSLEDFHRIYDELDVSFDVEFFESEVEKDGLKIVSELEKKGIVTESAGARIVEIDRQLHERLGEPLKDKYRVLVLVRADGASLYGAKDLALAKRKFKEHKIEESIYVVGNEQKFYFQQLFQILRLMGFGQWEKCYHLSYELVMLPSGKMSSREGQVVLYDDVMRELKRRALEVVNEKNPSLDGEIKDKVSQAVARGALIYGMLRVDTNKRIEFDFDEVLDFDGRSAPYIQYACARARSIFRKAHTDGIETPQGVEITDFSDELAPVEIDLLRILGRFPVAVRKVADDKKPIHLASYCYELAAAFSDFYHKCPVLTSEEPVRRHRMLLVKAVETTLEAALGLLGIDAPEVM